MTITALADLGSETFGEQIRRCRERSGIRLADAAAAISRFFPVSAPTLHRLEQLDSVPDDWRRQCVAWLAAVAYGFNPVTLGLPENPFPFPVEIDAVPDIVRNHGQALLPCTFGQHRWSAGMSDLALAA